jgi:hypothetical protein
MNGTQLNTGKASSGLGNHRKSRIEPRAGIHRIQRLRIMGDPRQGSVGAA